MNCNVAKALFISVALCQLGGAQAYASDQDEHISQLKNEIVSISAANTQRVDNFAEIRAKLQPLVDELVSLVPARSEAEKLHEVVGGWKNLWTDMFFGPNVDLTETYQVVDKAGFYYNISLNRAGGAVFADYLRGSYVDQGAYLRIQFTRDFTSMNWLLQGADLAMTGSQAESGAINGPDNKFSHAVGVKGNLMNTYVDGELRIVTGKSDGDAHESMFVLKRATAVE